MDDAPSDRDRAARSVWSQPVERSAPSPAPPAAPAVPDERDERALPKGKAYVAPAAPDNDESPGRRLRRQLRRIGAAGSISTLLHLLVLLALGVWVIHQNIVEPLPELLVTQSNERDEPIEVPPSFIPDSDPTTSFSSPVPGSIAPTTLPSVPTPTPSTQPSEQLPALPAVGPGIANVGGGPRGPMRLPKGIIYQRPVDAQNIDDAMDQITIVALHKLEQGPLLVVWCMDESESMNDDRQEIMSRIGKVYQELGIASREHGDRLLTAVTSYGAGWHNHLSRPTSNVDQIVAAMDAIENDPSGEEQMCPAILKSLETFLPFAVQGRRQIMLIVLTDESGDRTSNEAFLEPAIDAARRARAPVYFLGREAIFGYPYATMRHINPKTNAAYYARIDRGPETAFIEQLQYDGFHRRGDALPSGFGPYEQMRLAHETGGIFFMLPSPEVALVNRDTRKYPLDALLTYLPDLRSRADYEAERQKSSLRSLVRQIVAQFDAENSEIRSQIEIKSYFSLDPHDYAIEVERETARVRKVIDQLHAARLALEQVQRERDREASNRWRANYDLLHAQTIAYAVRLEEYLAYLDAFGRKPKPVENRFGALLPSNRWSIRAVPRWITDQTHRADIDRATALFKQIMADHPGTPWAARAEWELSRPYGIEFEEGYVGTPHPPGSGVPDPVL